MGVVIERKKGQAVRLMIGQDMSEQALLELIRSGITITVNDIGRHGTRTRIGIDAPRAVNILRSELLQREMSPSVPASSERLSEG
ncbi:carbon storage regulator [Ectopseudomonas hydrolytica]|uniref:carbon storage regulator n=1 Tax=Ectopseudomonas hydrolytica TaxID=2493633 RepID=UPI003EDF24D3